MSDEPATPLHMQVMPEMLNQGVPQQTEASLPDRHLSANNHPLSKFVQQLQVHLTALVPSPQFPIFPLRSIKSFVEFLVKSTFPAFYNLF